MTSRELVIRALNHEPVQRTPRDIWVLPGVESIRSDQVQEVEVRFPSDIRRVDFRYPPGRRVRGKPLKPGRYVDDWGCGWEVRQRGAHREICSAPLTDTAAMQSYRPPMELLEAADLTPVARQCEQSSRFMIAWTETRPLDRLRMLRGPKTALSDLARGRKTVIGLLDAIDDFCCGEIELWAGSDVDGVVFGDELAEDSGMILDPDLWRELFRPRYAQYVRLLQANDKFVFFRSAGDITLIWDDLVEIGVDAIHAELSPSDCDSILKRSRGRVALWGGLSIGQSLEAHTPAFLRSQVREFRRKVDYGHGGLIAQCSWSLNAPLKNLVNYLDEWAQPLPVHF